MRRPFSEFSGKVAEQIYSEKKDFLFNRRFKDVFNGSEQETKESEDRGIFKIIDTFALEEGGMGSIVEGHKYPVLIYADRGMVDLMTCYKRLLILQLLPLREGNLIEKLICILSLKSNLRIVEKWFEKLFSVYKIVLKDEHWCKPVKEVRRVLKGKISDIWLDVIASIIEWDTAYRWRIQDIVGEIDKNNLNSNILKEIKRLANIVFGREVYSHNGLAKLKKVLPLVIIYLFFNRKKLKMIKDILLDLDKDKIRLSTTDLYWTCNFKDYNFGGKSFNERLKLRKTL